MEREKFLDYIRFEKRYSPNTATAYATDLEQFYQFLYGQYGVHRIQEADHAMIRSWLVSLLENQNSPRSINRKITTLKSFYKFLNREGILTDNPLRKVVPPKSSKRLPVFVEREKMALLFDQIEFRNDYTGERNRMILELFYATGIRLSELVNLEEPDIDFHKRTLKVLGKRNKERIIPFSDKLASAMGTYLTCRRKFIDELDLPENGETKILFFTLHGKKMNPRTVYRVVNDYLSRVTTIEKKSPHVLRHTFATHMLNNGAELNAVKELLGHANLSATQVYTHLTIEKIKKVYQQAHPKA